MSFFTESSTLIIIVSAFLIPLMLYSHKIISVLFRFIRWAGLGEEFYGINP